MYLHARGIGDGQGVLREGVTGQALDLTLLLGGGGVRHMVGVRRNPGRGRETENRKFVTCDGDLLLISSLTSSIEIQTLNLCSNLY